MGPFGFPCGKFALAFFAVVKFQNRWVKAACHAFNCFVGVAGLVYDLFLSAQVVSSVFSVWVSFRARLTSILFDVLPRVDLKVRSLQMEWMRIGRIFFTAIKNRHKNQTERSSIFQEDTSVGVCSD
jgi:hypothetical protein